MTEQGTCNRVLVVLAISLVLASAGDVAWSERPILDIEVGWTNVIHADDTYVYLGQNAGVIKLLDKTNGTQLARNLTGKYEHTSHVIAMVADERYLYTGSPDRTVRIRDKAYDLVMISAPSLFQSEVTGVTVDEHYLYVITARDELIYGFNLTTGFILAEQIELEHAGDIFTDGDHLYACDDNSSIIHVMDPADEFKRMNTINQTDCPIYMFADDDYFYAVPRSDGDPRDIRVYNKKVGYQPVTTLSGHNGRITRVFADERYLYSSSHDGKVRVWEKNKSFAQVAVLDNGAGVQSLFVDDGRVYAGLVNRSLLVWEKPVRTASPFGYRGSLMCGDGYCGLVQGECGICPGDCQLKDCFGNRRCDTEVGENCATAPDECGCLPGEICIPVRTKSRDLGCYIVTCGDGNCDPGENKTSCYPDCRCGRGFYYSNGTCLVVVEQPTPEPTPEPTPVPTAGPNGTVDTNGTGAPPFPNATAVPGGTNVTDANGTALPANATPNPGIIVHFNTPTPTPAPVNVTANATDDGPDDLPDEEGGGIPLVVVAVLGSVVLAGAGYWATRLRGAEDPRAVVAADVQRARDKVRSLVPSRGGAAPPQDEGAVQETAPTAVSAPSAAVAAAPVLDIDAGLDEVATGAPATGLGGGDDLDLNDIIGELE
ncbi:MAG: hypothetical protein QGG50_07905 [Methanopyri archaeon]|jgi:hypothetical protein|nr:hypothetical protein [Methanopyri archaeon]